MHRYWRFALGIVFLGLCGWYSTIPVQAHHSPNEGDGRTAVLALPPGFMIRTVVSGLNLPTDMVILPSGDFLITEKGVGSGPVSKAQLRLVRQGILQPDPVLTLGVNGFEDSGLLSIILDPQFTDNHFIYLWYSTGEGSWGWTGTSYNRLSRFVYDEVSGIADPASETIILDGIGWYRIHNGSGLAFDDAGNLLITTGDAGSDPAFPTSHLAQSLTSLNGKVLRIHPKAEGGYDVPSDNPFFGNSVGTRPEIYAYGLRNPFRIVQRSADQEFYLIDLGQNAWEEVDHLLPGANYGWPYREGKCAIYQRVNCAPTPAQFTDPILAYLHPADFGAGITAMTFYESTQWPAQFHGRLFFADFNSEWIGTFDLNSPDQPYTEFATGIGSLVDMEATDEGIYAVSIYDQSIKLIYYDGEGNSAPVAAWETTPISGSAPLAVQFTVTAEDADNDALVYRWDFGDGNKGVSPLPTASHVYTQDGNYLATLQVVDEHDAKSEILAQQIQVYSGVRASIVQTNLTEAGRILYHGGDQIRFRAVREGDTAGLDATAPYAWTILLHHNEHAHVLIAQFVGGEVELDIPTDTHALGTPLWYEVQLHMKTETGQVIQSSHELRPETTTIQLQSWPGPTLILLNQQPTSPDELTTVIVGQEYTLEAPENLVFDTKVGTFKNWIVTESWPDATIAGGTQTITERQYTMLASAGPKAYIAFYEYLGDSHRLFLPSVTNPSVVD